ncbi:putative Auxin-induced protein 5NG4 [Hibiscus syriacus]|uniref:WAT1-related protein n=1 Tax=Hibiscus syriacus TaxID=106335 RepID=A0A6A2ZBG5_HIBSY|nr:putative Auxin-induced protein 5NG4 [Hibiscus syriacus]
MGLSSYIWSAVPFVAMITVECTDVGISVISKAALSKGMSSIVSVVYYNALGTLILLPYFIFCRNKQAPLTLSLLWRFFLLGLIGSSGQMVYLTGVKFSSPTLSSALANLIPIFTFLLAVIYSVAVTGAFVATLYKGPPVLINSSSPSNFLQQPLFSQQTRWIIGGFLMLLVCLSSATWNVLQTATVKEYPDKMTIVFFFTFFITIQSLVFSAILERNPSSWTWKSTEEVAAILCTAIFGSLFRIAIHTWCLQKKGPVFVAMFKPLGIPVSALLTITFLAEPLFLGRVIGSVIILVGFYTVIWGQAEEKRVDLENEAESSSHHKAPLLHHV